jgi:hypothetical protein
LGTIDEIKETFGDNIKGPIERTPVVPTELQHDDGTIVSLLRQALVRSLAEAASLPSDGWKEIWRLTLKRPPAPLFHWFFLGDRSMLAR